MPVRRTENNIRERARHQPVNWAQVEGAGLAGQAALPGLEPASASRSSSVNTGWTGTGEDEGIAAAISGSVNNRAGN